MNRQLKISCISLVLFFSMAFSAEATDLSGKWSGTWKSSSTGHKGPLHCTLKRIDDNRYQADFSGCFFKFIPFRYSLTLHVQQDGDVVTLSGCKTLGRRLGTFYYSAKADTDSFTASFRSSKDCGQFRMNRCCTFTNAKR